MKCSSKTKYEKGSITLFVLISMMFFTIVLVGLYISTSNRIQKQDIEIRKIQKSYKTQNINDIYNKSEERLKVE